MFKIISHPNLPQTQVKHCLIGSKYVEEIEELTGLGLYCIALKEDSGLDDEISCHSDILSFNFGTGRILVNKDSVGEEDLKKIGFNVTETDVIKSPYPLDIPLNVAYLKDKLICNSKYTAKEILDFANSNNIRIINTKQGYARCSLCIINENAVITEDNGLTCLLKNYQTDVLKISGGSVYLSESHSGFLGGASAKISKDKIYFSGDLSSHEDYSEIKKFLDKHHIEPIYNNSRPLRDFGGIVQLTELK